MDEILALRHESARLLDFGNYAEYSLATKMADSPQQVLQFLEELAEHAVEPARQDKRTTHSRPGMSPTGPRNCVNSAMTCHRKC